MPYVKRSHLCPAPTAGRGYCKAHLVIDIHEGEWTGGIGARTAYVCSFGSQGGEFITYAASCLQSKPGFVHFAQYLVHGVVDDTGDSTVDSGRGRLMLLGSGIGGDAPGRDGAMTECPQEFLPPLLL